MYPEERFAGRSAERSGTIAGSILGAFRDVSVRSAGRSGTIRGTIRGFVARRIGGVGQSANGQISQQQQSSQQIDRCRATHTAPTEVRIRRTRSHGRQTVEFSKGNVPPHALASVATTGRANVHFPKRLADCCRLPRVTSHSLANRRPAASAASAPVGRQSE